MKTWKKAVFLTILIIRSIKDAKQEYEKVLASVEILASWCGVIIEGYLLKAWNIDYQAIEKKPREARKK